VPLLANRLKQLSSSDAIAFPASGDEVALKLNPHCGEDGPNAYRSEVVKRRCGQAAVGADMVVRHNSLIRPGKADVRSSIANHCQALFNAGNALSRWYGGVIPSPDAAVDRSRPWAVKSAHENAQSRVSPTHNLRCKASHGFPFFLAAQAVRPRYGLSTPLTIPPQTFGYFGPSPAVVFV
jgi:hypothetical protein